MRSKIQFLRSLIIHDTWRDITRTFFFILGYLLKINCLRSNLIIIIINFNKLSTRVYEYSYFLVLLKSCHLSVSLEPNPHRHYRKKIKFFSFLIPLEPIAKSWKIIKLLNQNKAWRVSYSMPRQLSCKKKRRRRERRNRSPKIGRWHALGFRFFFFYLSRRCAHTKLAGGQCRDAPSALVKECIYRPQGRERERNNGSI